MKKRILSFALALVMVLATFVVIPTSVFAAASTESVSGYQFEENDARNLVDGQVFDVASKGEALAAPKLDGVINSYEYSVTGAMKRRTTVGTTAAATLPVSFAVKDGYLYVAFTYEGETAQSDIQFDIGVLQDGRTDGAWSRKQVTWYGDNTTGDQSWLMTNHGQSSWLKWSATLDTDYFLVEKAWSTGVYEAKFDLKAYYKLFGISPRGNGIYDTPCVSIAIWYDVNNTITVDSDEDGTKDTLTNPDNPGQTHYAFPLAKSTAINSAVSTGWVPATVIIPEKSLALINKDKNSIGALGEDYLNVVEGQLLNNGRVYSSTLPAVDGTVNEGEYSASQVYTGNTYTTDGNMTMSYSVGKDGLVYVALQYKEAAHSRMLVQAGLSTNAAPVQASRVGVQLNTNGTRSNQNSLWKDPMNTSGWLGSMWGGYSQNNARCDTSSATTHVDGLTTYEFTLSIPMMIESLEEAGWSADTANGIYFYFFQGTGNVQYKVPGRTVAQETALKKMYGFDYSVGYWSPTIALPEDAIDRFEADTLEEIERKLFALDGQANIDVNKGAPATLDGVISEGEYSKTQSWDKTTARASDSQLVPGIDYDISGKNYITYDDEYLYFGAEVYDPNYVSGQSQFQFNLSVVDETKPVDNGNYVTRISTTATMTDSGATCGNWGGVKRSQTCYDTGDDATKYAGQSAWVATFKTTKPELSGNYNADTKTLTYEFKVSLAQLAEIFGVEYVEKIHFITLAVYTDKDTDEKNQHAWNLYKDTTDRVADIVRNWTAKANSGSVAYDSNFFGHVIYLVDSGKYTYEFDEKDVRNAVDGQVFDLAAKGEAAVAPTMDGVIDANEYTTSGTIKLEGKQAGASPLSTLPVYFAVKDAYLYVAFTYEGDAVQRDIQYDIGVLNDSRSDLAWTRKQATWKADNTTHDHSWLSKAPGTTTWLGYTRVMDSDEFLLDMSWSNGTYEAKFDLREYYDLMGILPSGKGVYDSPCVAVAFWYDVSNTLGDHDSDETTPDTLKDPEGAGQSHYAFPVSGFKHNSDVNTGWLPATVIIPDESMAIIKSLRNAIGEVGTDYANAVAGQLTNNGRVYSDVLPVIDGVVNDGEYSKTQTYTGSTYTTDTKFNLSYSIGENGLAYVALTYKEATHSQIIVQPGLAVNASPVMTSRTGFTIKPGINVASNQNALFKNYISNTWHSDFWGHTDKYLTQCYAQTASVHNAGTTTVEFTISIPMMIESLENAGWVADTANAIWFYFFFGSGAVQYKVPGFASATESALTIEHGYSYTLGYWSPTVALPEDAIERFNVETVEDAERLFAETGLDIFDAAPSDVTLDGKISAGEYTAIQEWDKTTARGSDGQHYPGIDYDISGKNFITYDDEYLYFGAEVYDPNYVSGTSYFQLNLSAFDDDVVYDIGHNVRRINMSFQVKDGVAIASNYGGILRSQITNSSIKDDAGNMYVYQNAWRAGFEDKMPELAAVYDEATKTITYEAKIKISDLEEAFGIDDLEKIHFMTLAVYADKNDSNAAKYAWNFYVDTSYRVMDILRNWSIKGNNGVLVYDSVMYGHIVKFNKGFATRQSGSVRLSTTVSGLRFKTTYTDEYLEEMKAYATLRGEEMIVGTLIAPNDFVTAAGEFTHAALGEGKYVEVIANIDNAFKSENGVTTIAGSLVNIKEGNLGRAFAGIGYIQIGDEIFYSDTYAVKSVSEVAQSALDDTSAAQTSVYKYEVSAGVWSPYNEGQRLVLEGLIA